MDGLSASAATLGLTGARPIDGGLDFGDPQAESRAALKATTVFPLLHLRWLRARGPEADAFLQGQLSNDIRRLTTGRAQLSSYSTPKGRALALFTLLREADGGVLLEIQAAIAAATLKRLRMFVLRSKLLLEDAGDRFGALGLAGSEAIALLAAAGLPAPAAAWDCAGADGLIVLRRPDARPRFSVHGPQTALAALWQRWSARARPAGTASWRLLDILAGQPSVHAETRELFVPQMLNLDLLDGISFSKGCYPGQEIVARLHYLGTAKRRLMRAFVDVDALPSPGAALYRRNGDGQAVAEVVDAMRHPRGDVAMLAVVQASETDPVDLQLGKGGDARSLSALESLI